MTARSCCVLPAAVLAAALAVTGCTGTLGIESELKGNGLVVILPGIEGQGDPSYSIRGGLVTGGVDRAVVIWNWGRPIPLIGMFLNQVDFLGNRLAAWILAKQITAYQKKYPGRPVHIVGHSGGGGIAVFIAECLAGRSGGLQIDGLILLSASISSGYNLTKALSSCKNGIVNFYNPRDVGILGIGTLLLGNIDGGRGAPAGLYGFVLPSDKASPAKREAYTGLYQDELVGVGGTGQNAHMVATDPDFIAGHAAPWVLSPSWPPQTK